MEKFDLGSILPDVKVNSPVFRLNFNDDNHMLLVGMYIITLKDPGEFLKDYIEMEGINNNSLLFFQLRYRFDIYSIIAGILKLFNTNIKAINEYIYMIDKNIHDCITYEDFLKFFDNIKLRNAVPNGIDIPEQLEVNYLNIMTMIWFIPYNKLDEILKLAIEEMKKQYEKDEESE